MILTILQCLLVNIINLDNNRKKPVVRLQKKQEDFQINMTTDEIEMVVITIFGILLLLGAFLFLTSCTESGLIYNGELA